MDNLDKEILERKLRKLALFLFFLVVFFSFVYPVLDPDTPWHLRTGEYIVANGTIPMSSDPFSFAGQKIPYLGRFILSQNWLAQSLFFLIYRTWGPLGLVITRAAVFTLIISIIWYLIYRRKGLLTSVIASSAVTYLLRVHFSGIRSQIFTFLFAATLILLIEKYREKRSARWLFPLPLLMLLWANMHGGFIYGVVLIIIYLIGEAAGFVLKDRPASHEENHLSARQLVFLLAIGLISVLVSLINPNTYEAFVYTFMSHMPGYSVHKLSQTVEEYKSPYSLIAVHPALTYGFFVCVACAFVMAIIFIRRRQLTPLLLLLFAITPALIASRYIPLFLIVAVPLLAYIPRARLPEPPLRFKIGTRVAMIAFFSFLAIYGNPFRSRDILRFNDNYHYPVRAANFLLKNNIKGNVFASYNTAAFILFRCYPGSRIFFDSRFVDAARLARGLEIEGVFDSPSTELATISKLVPAGLGNLKITVSGGGKKTGGVEGDGDRWKKLLNKINADIIVHEAVNHFSGVTYPLVLKLVRDDMWKLVYADGTVMIFVRNEPRFRDTIDRYQLPKSRIYDEILVECLNGAGGHRGGHYSSIALALLLKGIADKHTSFFLDKALSLSPSDIVADYSKALFLLMKQEKKSGALQTESHPLYSSKKHTFYQQPE
jgi:hypothetical protein